MSLKQITVCVVTSSSQRVSVVGRVVAGIPRNTAVLRQIVELVVAKRLRPDRAAVISYQSGKVVVAKVARLRPARIEAVADHQLLQRPIWDSMSTSLFGKRE